MLLVILTRQDAQVVRRLFHCGALCDGNLAVQRLASPDGEYCGFGAGLKLLRIVFQDGGVVKLQLIMLGHRALPRGGIFGPKVFDCQPVGVRRRFASSSHFSDCWLMAA